jgi:nucleoside-diphosphate-sugar epimerase
MKTRALVTGAGGFIGHHLTKYLVTHGYKVLGVDIKEPEYEPTAAHDFQLLDLRRFDNCLIATRGVDEIYHLAADMGGIGYISSNRAAISRNNAMINLHTLEAARLNKASRFCAFFGAYILSTPRTSGCHTLEEGAWPADPKRVMDSKSCS